MFEVSKVIHSSEITWLDECTKEFLKLPPSEFLFLEPMADDDSNIWVKKKMKNYKTGDVLYEVNNIINVIRKLTVIKAIDSDKCIYECQDEDDDSSMVYNLNRLYFFDSYKDAVTFLNKSLDYTKSRLERQLKEIKKKQTELQESLNAIETHEK